MVQIDLRPVTHAGAANQILQQYPIDYPKRKVLSVCMVPETHGWFMTITYEINM